MCAVAQYSTVEVKLSTLMCSAAPDDIWLYATDNGNVSVKQESVEFELPASESAWIDCEASGKPSPSFRWFLVEQTDEQKELVPWHRMQNERLELRNEPLRQIARASFVCVASNTINGQTMSATHTVKVMIRAPSATLDLSNLSVLAILIVGFVCVVVAVSALLLCCVSLRKFRA